MTSETTNLKIDKVICLKRALLKSIINPNLWCQEIEILSQLHHPNIVDYSGYLLGG
jgi:hypothetical protein